MNDTLKRSDVVAWLEAEHRRLLVRTTAADKAGFGGVAKIDRAIARSYLDLAARLKSGEDITKGAEGDE